MSRKLILLVLAASVAAGCSDLDCNELQRYHGAKLEKPISAPEGLVTAEPTDTHRVPGGEPPADYATGACLVRPPQLVAVPEGP